MSCIQNSLARAHPPRTHRTLRRRRVHVTRPPPSARPLVPPPRRPTDPAAVPGNPGPFSFLEEKKKNHSPRCPLALLRPPPPPPPPESLLSFSLSLFLSHSLSSTIRLPPFTAPTTTPYAHVRVFYPFPSLPLLPVFLHVSPSLSASIHVYFSLSRRRRRFPISYYSSSSSLLLLHETGG